MTVVDKRFIRYRLFSVFVLFIFCFRLARFCFSVYFPFAPRFRLAYFRLINFYFVRFRLLFYKSSILKKGLLL